MTDLLEKAIAAVRVLEPEDQDRIAAAMLTPAEGSEPEDIDPEHLPDILRSLAEAERGTFATYEEVEAIFARVGR